jgi:hypothetical protein
MGETHVNTCYLIYGWFKLEASWKGGLYLDEIQMKGSLESDEDMKMFIPWMVLMLKVWMNIWWNWPIISLLLAIFVFQNIGNIWKNILLFKKNSQQYEITHNKKTWW